MLGKTLISWFELFAGIAVYKITDQGPDNAEGWINIEVIERRFEKEKLKFCGNQYNPSDPRQKENLLNAIIHNAQILCEFGILEKYRSMYPPRLEYRVTKLGRKIDALRGIRIKELRKKFFFFRKALWQQRAKYTKIITIGTFGMGVVNALRFYSVAFTWISEMSVLALSLLAAVTVFLIAVIKSE